MKEDDEVLGLIGDAARSFVRQWGGAALVRKRVSEVVDFNREEWNAVIEQGWLGVMVPEAKGGLGLSARALTVVLQQIGETLVMPPILNAMATAVLLAGLDTSYADELLSDLLSGEALILTALPDGASPTLLPALAHGWVHDALGADGLLVWDDENRQLLHLGADQMHHVKSRSTIDGGSISTVTLPDGNRRVVADGTAALQALSTARDVIGIGSAAMALGCAKQAFEITLAYMKERKQFGAPIGSFQALQHRAASLHVALASSESFLVEASHCFNGPNRSAASSAVRARSADCALQVVKEAVQLHGAIGFADEHEVGLYFRRIVALASWHGNSAAWRRHYCRSDRAEFESRKMRSSEPDIPTRGAWNLGQ
jgi:alkylation response protein AidB-like acyl-CoA dehydrogenase